MKDLPERLTEDDGFGATAVVLSSAVVALTETNLALTTGGTLTILDVDSATTFVAQTGVTGTNGTFSVNTAGAWSYVANSAFNSLNVGSSVSDTFTVASADGTLTSVKVTINGSNDVATLSSAVVALTETNSALSTSGTLTISDVDSDNTFIAQTNVHLTSGNGTFSINTAGAWSYEADSAFNNLNVGSSVSDTFTVASADGTLTSVKVTINGSNDAAILSSSVISLDETDAALTTGGTLTILDVDSATTFVAQTGVTGTNGTFGISTAGVWSYVANSAFNSLNVGSSVSDTFTVYAADGTQTSVKVTINGSNDVATLSSAVVALTETNLALTTGGTLTILDVDSAATFVAQTGVTGTNGTFGISTAGVWSYVANSAFDSLTVGQSVSETFTVYSADNTSTTVKVTINGTIEDINNNDASGLGTNDTIAATGGSAQTLYGGAGNDTITANKANDTIYGGSGNDTIDGGDGSDLIYGGSGADSIVGGLGNDTIYGGYGADTMTGGTSADTFMFSTLFDSGDTITDFVAGTDKLNLSGIDANSATTGTNDAFSLFANTATVHANSVNYWQSGGNTIIQTDSDGNVATVEFTLTLTGFTASNLVAGDFIL